MFLFLSIEINVSRESHVVLWVMHCFGCKSKNQSLEIEEVLKSIFFYGMLYYLPVF